MARDKFDAIIIDPDLDSRMRLKQATSSVYNFRKVVQAVDLNEALSKLQSGVETADVIFVSYRFDQKDVTKFIANSKATRTGQDCAYILVMKTKNQDSSTVALNVMVGADGFLFEPYSVDYLLEITKLADQVKAERSASREKAAMGLVVQDMMHQVDQAAYLKACRYEYGRNLRKLKELSAVFSTFDAAKTETYFDIAIRMFGEAPIPKPVQQHKRYAGVSNRIKRKMEEKLISELEQEHPPAPAAKE